MPTDYHNMQLADRNWTNQANATSLLQAKLLLMYVGVVELLRNLPLYGGGFVLTVNTRFREPA